MSATEPTPEVRFLLYVERDKHSMDGLTITAHPIHFTDVDEVRNITADSWQPNPLADFEVRALADKAETFGESYGWSREYRNVFSVDTERASVMLKQLRAIDRGMDKLEKEFGYAKDFASYLARVASVLKIRSFGWKVADGGERWAYSGNEYGWGDATRMSDWISRQLADYRKTEQPA